MPCYDPTPPAEYEAHYAKEKIDKLTKLLCEAVILLEDSLADGSQELQDWSQEHVTADMDRLIAERDEAIEKARQEWVKSLTPYEKMLIESN